MAAGSGDPRAGGRKKVPLRLGAAGAARGWRNEKEGGPSLGGRPPAIRSIATRFGLVEMLPSLGDGYFCLSRKPGLQADLRLSGGRVSLDLDPQRRIHREARQPGRGARRPGRTRVALVKGGSSAEMPARTVISPVDEMGSSTGD